MRLLRLTAGLLVIALAVGAQDPAAPDYYDYYDDPTADVGSPQDASAAGLDQGASAPAKEGEEALADDPVTEPTVTTTTVATTTEGRRKLVSLKSAKIGRSRGESRHTTTEAAVAEISPAATLEAESGAGGRRFGGSTLARSGIQRTRSNSRLSATQPETENTAEASPAASPVRSRFRPSARSEPAATTDETQGSTSNRFQPRRSSFRPSSSSSNSDAPAEEATDKPAPSRFRPASRNSFRPSNSRPATESSTSPADGEATEAPHRFGTARRGRGNSRGGSAFQPNRGSTEQAATNPEEVVEEEETAVASDPSRFGRRSRA